MTEEEKITREYAEIAELKARSMYSIPLNPSDSGYSPEQIKQHMYGGEFYLYRLLKAVREHAESLDEDLQEVKTNGIAKYDDQMNIIRNTYATKAETVPKGIRVFGAITPKTMTEANQNEAMLYVDNNGQPAKVPINGLDYSKLSVMAKENQTPLHFDEDIRINDYFIEED